MKLSLQWPQYEQVRAQPLMARKPAEPVGFTKNGNFSEVGNILCLAS